MAWTWGACSGVTVRAPIENSATRSEKYHWAQAETPAIAQHEPVAQAGVDQHAHQDHVEQAEDEHGAAHPGGQTTIGGVPVARHVVLVDLPGPTARPGQPAGPPQVRRTRPARRAAGPWAPRPRSASTMSPAGPDPTACGGGSGHGGRRLRASDLRLHRRELVLDLVVRRESLQLGGQCVLAAGRLEGTCCHELLHGTGPSLHLRGAVLRALDGQADITELAGDPGERLVDAHLRLRGRVGGLDGLLLGAERLDLGLQLLGGHGELLLLHRQLLELHVQVGDLLADGGLADQRLASQVLATGRQRRPGLVIELGQLLVQAGDLQLDPLAAGGHVGHAAPDLLQHLQLLLVGVVQGLCGILRLVHGRVGLGAEDHLEALPHSSHGSRSLSLRAAHPPMTTSLTPHRVARRTLAL